MKVSCQVRSERVYRVSACATLLVLVVPVTAVFCACLYVCQLHFVQLGGPTAVFIYAELTGGTLHAASRSSVCVAKVSYM